VFGATISGRLTVMEPSSWTPASGDGAGPGALGTVDSAKPLVVISRFAAGDVIDVQSVALDGGVSPRAACWT